MEWHTRNLWLLPGTPATASPRHSRMVDGNYLSPRRLATTHCQQDCKPHCEVSRRKKMTTLFTHPLLGTLRGRRVDTVVQFLGIRYGTFTQRFAPPSIYDARSNGDGQVIDATAYGYVIRLPTQCRDPFGLMEKFSTACGPRKSQCC